MRSGLTMVAALLAGATACLSPPSRSSDGGPDQVDEDGGPPGGDAAPADDVCAQPSLLADDFATLDLDQWNTWEEPSMTIDADGDVRINYDTTGQAGIRTRDGFRLHESSAWIRVVQLPDDQTSAQLFFTARRGEDAVAETVEFKAQGGNLHLQIKPEVGSKIVVATLPYDPEAHRWWRLREEDGRIHWDVSVDGESFVELESRADPFPLEDLNLLVYGNPNTAAVPPGEGHVDDYNGGVETRGAWCGAQTLSDDFDDGVLSPMWEPSVPDGCAITETEGTVAIEAVAEWSGSCSMRTRQRFDLRSSEVIARVTDIPMVTGTTAELRLETPSGEAIIMQVDDGAIISAIASGTLVWSATYDPAAHQMWRIRDLAGGQIAFDTWDGTDWTTQMQGTWEAGSRQLLARLQFSATVALPASQVVRFDDFNIEP